MSNIFKIQDIWFRQYIVISGCVKNLEQAAGGDFYHIELKSKDEFVKFGTQDVGDKGGLERVAGQRKDGSWHTVKWFLSKGTAQVEDGKLVPDHKDAENLFRDLPMEPRRLKEIFFRPRDLGWEIPDKSIKCTGMAI